MQTHAFRFFPRCLLSLGAAFFCLYAVALRATETEPTPIQAKIMRLQDLSDTQRDESLKQLLALLKDLPDDAPLGDRRDALAALIEMYADAGQQQEARKFNAELGALGIRYHDDRTNARALDYQAELLEYEGKFDQAADVIEQALLIAARVDDKKLASRVNSTASIVYSDLGNFQSALQHQLVALDSLEAGNRRAELQRISEINIISTLYLNLKDPQMALEYNAKATKLAERLNAQDLLASLAVNRANAYSSQGKLDDAVKTYLETLVTVRKTTDRRWEGVILTNLADVSLSQGHYASCVQFAQQAIPLLQKMSDGSTEAMAWSNQGLCHMSMGSVAQGVAEVDRGIAFFRTVKAKPSIEVLLGQLSTAYEKAGLYKEALKTMQEQRSLTAELFRTDRDRALTEMKAKFDASQREKQIEALEQKNQVQSVELKNKSLQRIVSLLSTLAAGAVAVTIAVLYRKVQKSNRELHETNLKLEQQSTHDPLTGLLNRRAFQDKMKTRSQRVERRATGPVAPPHALALLDIDHFKLINDNYGHTAGDLVLVEISRRLQPIMRENDMLMRWGGEEFLIFLNHIPIEHLTTVIQRVLDTVARTAFVLDERSISVTISIGFISLPQADGADNELNWEKALQLADAALYMAKAQGRNQAIGVGNIDVPPSELAELLQGDLEPAVARGAVKIHRIAGPVAAQASMA